MKPYQADRQDLLINTDYGISRGELSEDKATGLGLVLFGDRWVTREQEGILRKQRGAYRAFMLCGILCLAVSISFALIGYTICASGVFTGYGPWRNPIASDDRFFIAVMCAAVAVGYGVYGVGMLKLKCVWDHTSMPVMILIFCLPWRGSLAETFSGGPVSLVHGATIFLWIVYVTVSAVRLKWFSEIEKAWIMRGSDYASRRFTYLCLYIFFFPPLMFGIMGMAGVKTAPLFILLICGIVWSVIFFLPRIHYEGMHDAVDGGDFYIRAALDSGDIRRINSLLHRDDMNVKDSHLSAALCKAAWAGRTEAVKLLLERGAGTPAQEDGDWTPMRGAVAGGDKEMQELLRAHGAASFEVVGQLPKPAAFQNAQALSKPT